MIVSEVASAYQASLLVVEGSQLAGLVHANIASLAAACLDSSCPLLAYTSTPGELNLKLYLTDGNHHPGTRDLVHVGAQVARAGAFLHGRGLLHRWLHLFLYSLELIRTLTELLSQKVTKIHKYHWLQVGVNYASSV